MAWRARWRRGHCGGTPRTQWGAFRPTALSAPSDRLGLGRPWPSWGCGRRDLRRTVMTYAAASGVSAYVLRDLLGHKTAQIADRYIRAVSSPVREARERIGGQMAAQMAGKPPAEVTPLAG
ncbi:MAG: hypothetical protein OXF68_02560 [Gammaproteobacteria bacterium]|nr:hypothetical protein [Gammaproteobacteria bacterium]